MCERASIWLQCNTTTKLPLGKIRGFYRMQSAEFFLFLSAVRICKDKEDNEVALVCGTHGFVKKTDKVSPQEIEKAEQIRIEYLAYRQAGFKQKNKGK